MRLLRQLDPLEITNKQQFYFSRRRIKYGIYIDPVVFQNLTKKILERFTRLRDHNHVIHALQKIETDE